MTRTREENAADLEFESDKMNRALELLEEIAKAELWTEAENGSDDTHGFGSVTREFQEFREEEAQDWVIKAREISVCRTAGEPPPRGCSTPA